MRAPTRGLSRRQLRVLSVLAHTNSGGLPTCFLVSPVFGVPTGGTSDSIRASLSRCTRRLDVRGLIDHTSGFSRITEAGRAAAKGVTFDPHWLNELSAGIRVSWFKALDGG